MHPHVGHQEDRDCFAARHSAAVTLVLTPSNVRKLGFSSIMSTCRTARAPASVRRSGKRRSELPTASSRLLEVLEKREQEITDQWIEKQQTTGRKRTAAEREQSARQSRDFVRSLETALKQTSSEDISGPEWAGVRDFLVDLSSRRAKDGFTPRETASFVFSLKQPLFAALQAEFGKDAAILADESWRATLLIDDLGMLTTDAFQKSREEVILRQQKELLELSTPVVRLWENILALPLIGTLDSARTQVVMQNLLEAIVQTRSDYAIIDITGVPVVDTLVAQHLLKTVAAARLMGADCLISGIRPQIAQTIIHLGVDLSEVTTKATLADAFEVALRRSGHKVVRQDAAPVSAAAR
jgi:rsbT co-antagonist protein RsbR